MKSLIVLVIGFIFQSSTFGNAGDYVLKGLRDHVYKNIYETIDKYVESRSLKYSGKGAGYHFDFGCQESAYGKIYCSFSYSDGGGLTGLGYYTFDSSGKYGKRFRILE